MSVEVHTQLEKIEQLDDKSLVVKKSKEIAKGICEFFWSLHKESNKSLDRSFYLDRYGNIDSSQAERYMRVQKMIFKLSDRCVAEVLFLLEDNAIQ